MVAEMRLLSALCALVAAVVVVWQANPAGPITAGRVQLRSTDTPMTTIKSPVIDVVDPSPFDPRTDIPLDVVQRIGLASTPPTLEDSLRYKYDAGDYQMALRGARVAHLRADPAP